MRGQGGHLKYPTALLLAALFVFSACAQSQVIESGPYDWKDFGADAASPGETSKLFEGSSDAFEYLYIAVTSVGAGESFVLPHDNEDLETLLIMKSGILDQTITDSRKQMGRGSVSLIMPGDKIEIDNGSMETATLYVIMWRAKRTDGGAVVESTENARSLLIDWNDATVVKIEKGERRYLIDAPTAMMGQFKMHVTTLNEGMTSHPPHTHIEEEIILVRRGEVEENIDGELHQVGAGSLIFLRSMVPHGIRNIGQGQAEYFAFKWAPKEQ
jgi:(S)-ureidoglycine aminohydrolase